MKSKYVEIDIAEVSMNGKSPSGDLIEVLRTNDATFIVFVDGVGHGYMARISAKFIISRIVSHLKQDITLRKVFYNELSRRETHKENSKLHGYFTIIRIAEDGMSTILSYGMPKSLFVNPKYSTVLNFRNVKFGQIEVYEASSYLEDGEGIIAFCDGISTAGIGTLYREGWGETRITAFINETLSSNAELSELPYLIINKAKEIWNKKIGDDCTVAIARIRKCQNLNIFTGCPVDRNADTLVVKKFMEADGVHIVAGGSTAKLVSRELNEKLEVIADTSDLNVPVFYKIKGIDLVTEGVNTLNQLNNLLGQPYEKYESDDPVFDFFEKIIKADKINFFIGTAQNPANKSIIFRQKGIESRSVIIPKLVSKLEILGKIVQVFEM